MINHILRFGWEGIFEQAVLILQRKATRARDSKILSKILIK
jgi:hypothetical protein